MTISSKLFLPSWKQLINEKIEEADFFLKQLKMLEQVSATAANADNHHFRFYTGAFLGAVRLPQQYMLEAWQLTIPGASGRTIPNWVPKAWYDNAMTVRPVLTFMADVHRINVHTIAGRSAGHAVIDCGMSKPDSYTGRQEWPTYFGADKTVTGIAQEAIDSVRDLVNEGISLGHIR